MHHTHESTFPFFGEDINALSYISWEREIDDLVHSFHPRHSKYYFLTLCISSFVGHAKEWWDYRQSRVERGRKSPIQNWSELRACMRRTFIPPFFDFDREIEKKKIEIARRKEEKLTILLREMRELEEKERIRIQRREQQEREKFEQELREEEEQLRKEKEKKELKDLEEREEITQESNLEIQSQVVELKIISNAKKDLIVKDLVLNLSLIPSLRFQFSNEALPSLNSIHFDIKCFVLFLSQLFCSQSHSLISPSSTSYVPTHFDSKIHFKNYLSQSVKHFFEVGLIPSFSIFKSPFSHISQSLILHGHYDFNIILFDGYCRYIFDPGGIHL